MASDKQHICCQCHKRIPSASLEIQSNVQNNDNWKRNKMVSFLTSGSISTECETWGFCAQEAGPQCCGHPREDPDWGLLREHLAAGSRRLGRISWEQNGSRAIPCEGSRAQPCEQKDARDFIIRAVRPGGSTLRTATLETSAEGSRRWVRQPRLQREVARKPRTRGRAAACVAAAGTGSRRGWAP